jgi:hypothetical protein
MGALFASLKAGDMLMIPCNECGEAHTHDFAVLKTEQHDGGIKIWISNPNPGKHHLLMPGVNPLSWEADKKIILDRDGDEFPLETGDFQIEREAAMAAYQKHMALPKIRWPKAKITKDDINTALEELKPGNIVDQILNMAENGELKTTGEIAALTLANLGTEPTPTLVAAVLSVSFLLKEIGEAAELSVRVVRIRM